LFNDLLAALEAGAIKEQLTFGSTQAHYQNPNDFRTIISIQSRKETGSMSEYSEDKVQQGNYSQEQLIMPFYIICDVSWSMKDNNNIDALNSGLKDLVDDISKDAIVSDATMISIITFSGNAEVVVPLAPAYDIELPTLTAGGGTYYGAALEKYADTVKKDHERIRAQGSRFYRPCVFFLTDGEPLDDWKPVFHKVIHYDKKTGQGNKMYPYIVSFGFAGARKEVLTALAYPNFGEKQGRAFFSDSGNVHQLLDSIRDFIGKSVMSSGKSVGDGNPQIILDGNIKGMVSAPPAPDENIF